MSKLSDQQVLTACIERAIEGGYTPTPLFLSFDATHGQRHIKYFPNGFIREFPHPLIFDPSFAKALWGDEFVDNGAVAVWSGQTKPSDVHGPAEYDTYYEPEKIVAWAYHLQQLAIAPNRIQYLRDWLGQQND